jgi:hypothetical protein
MYDAVSAPRRASLPKTIVAVILALALQFSDPSSIHKEDTNFYIVEEEWHEFRNSIQNTLTELKQDLLNKVASQPAPIQVGTTDSLTNASKIATYSSGRLADFLQPSTPTATIPMWGTGPDTTLLRTGISSGAELAGSQPTSALTGVTSGSELIGSRPISTLTNISTESVLIGSPGQK